MSMKIEEILQLLDAVSKSEITELDYKEGGTRLSLKKTPQTIQVVQNAQPVNLLAGGTESSVSVAAGSPFLSSVTSGSGYTVEAKANTTEERFTDKNERDDREASSTASGKEDNGQKIVSPLVGTYYAAPAEDAEPYVKVGDYVEKGQVIAIVEAMKLMNEIESDFTGTVTEIFVENGQPVEYGQPLIAVKEG